MKRRKFLKTSAAASALVGALPAGSLLANEESAKVEKEYYELRLFHLRRGDQSSRMNDFLRQAWVPAMNRLGVSPIGVFEVIVGPDSPTFYVLIPYKSLDWLVTARDRLSTDVEFQKAGAAVINAPATEPSYVRMESSLMVAFDGMPRLEVPPAAMRQGGRIFELRTYESHSRKANKKKIGMFNTGEIAIFRRTGLQPVFFGETLVGSRQPQLTYLLVFENMEARDKDWAKFVSDPEWKKLSTTPGYTDAEIISNITNVLLRPTSYSQI